MRLCAIAIAVLVALSAGSAFADPPGIPFDLGNTANRDMQIRSQNNPCPDDPNTGFGSKCNNPLIWPDEAAARWGAGSGVSFADFSVPGKLTLSGTSGQFGTEGAFAAALGGYANRGDDTCTSLLPGGTCTTDGIVEGSGNANPLTIDLVTGKADFSTNFSSVNLAVELPPLSKNYIIIELVLRSTTDNAGGGNGGDLVTRSTYDVFYYTSLTGDDTTAPIATSCQESPLVGTGSEPIECTLGLGNSAKVELGLLTLGNGDLVFQTHMTVDNGLLDPSFVPLKFRFEEIWESGPVPAVPTVLLPILGLGLAIPAMWMVSRRRQ
jgi:hypothetical protein